MLSESDNKDYALQGSARNLPESLLLHRNVYRLSTASDFSGSYFRQSQKEDERVN